MAEFVIDANAAAKLVLDEPHAVQYRKWYRQGLNDDRRLHASSMLAYEVAQTLCKKLPQVPVEVLERCLAGIDLHEAWFDAVRYADDLTVYDASYLAVAVKQRATLVTYDRKLADVARKAGVKVLAP